MENLNAGDKFTVSIADDSKTATVDGKADAAPTKTAATTYDTMSNPTELTVASGATSFEQTYYLQHGQYIAIRGLPKGAAYTVTEDAEDYKQAHKAQLSDTLKFEDGTYNETTKAITGTLTTDAKVGFTNTRQGTVPTGIVLSVVPAVIVFTLALAALIVIAVRRKRAE